MYNPASQEKPIGRWGGDAILQAQTAFSDSRTLRIRVCTVVKIRKDWLLSHWTLSLAMSDQAKGSPITLNRIFVRVVANLADLETNPARWMTWDFDNVQDVVADDDEGPAEPHIPFRPQGLEGMQMRKQ